MTSTREIFPKRGGVKHTYATILQPQEKMIDVEQDRSTVCKELKECTGNDYLFSQTVKTRDIKLNHQDAGFI